MGVHEPAGQTGLESLLGRPHHWPADLPELPRAEAPPVAPDPPLPTDDQRFALPIPSLPFAWRQISGSLPRRGAVTYLDGMSVLLELALRGLVDVPPVERRGGRRRSGSVLVAGAGTTGNPALDGALDAIRGSGDPLEAKVVAVRLAPYVGALVVHDVGAAERRARIRAAVLGEVPADIRVALLVWMFKQDMAAGGSALEVLFPESTGPAGRALRRASPDLYALAEREVAATAHRVIFALLLVPGLNAEWPSPL